MDDISKVDWNQCYIANEAPWDSGEVSPELLKRFTEWEITPHSHRRLLEIGCGTGTNALYFAERGHEVTATDLATEALKAAKAKQQSQNISGVHWIQADFLKTDWNLAPFPVVFDRGCYHILRRIDVNAYLKALDSLTEAGSLFFLLTGNAQEPLDPGPPVVSAEELCRELGQIFHLKELREVRFAGVKLDGQSFAPLAWSSVWQKPGR